MLLGQYSDDELDEESSKNINDTIVENFLADLDDQVFKCFKLPAFFCKDYTMPKHCIGGLLKNIVMLPLAG